jgi:hypothetical protein
VKNPLALVALLVAAAAHANDRTVMGLTLGEPFTVAECGKRQVGTIVLYDSATSATGPCFKRGYLQERETGPIANGSVRVEFPMSATPSFVSGFAATALVMEGKLEGLMLGTRGVNTQELALDGLTSKFGKPSTLDRRTVQNRMGASFETFDAAWTTSSGLMVTFRAVVGSLDQGVIYVDTFRASDHRAKSARDAAQTDRAKF